MGPAWQRRVQLAASFPLSIRAKGATSTGEHADFRTLFAPILFPRARIWTRICRRASIQVRTASRAVAARLEFRGR